MRADIDASLDGEQRENLLNEVDNILSIFSSLLRISEIETEKRKDAFALVELKKLIQDATELYAPLAEDKNITFNQELESMSILGDRDLLFQMCCNLLDNAIKFTPADGFVGIACKQVEDAVVIEVSDTGPGVAAKLREKVLRRFFRVDSSRTLGGNGLGLALVAAVVKLHRGTLELTDNESLPTITQRPGLRCVIAFKHV